MKPIAFNWQAGASDDPSPQTEFSPPLRRQQGMAVSEAMKVRRLSVTECERLQGFPDGWTNVPYRGKPAADGPRYKALGNSMAVPCMKWLGERIQMVEGLLNE